MPRCTFISLTYSGSEKKKKKKIKKLLWLSIDGDFPFNIAAAVTPTGEICNSHVTTYIYTK